MNYLCSPHPCLSGNFEKIRPNQDIQGTCYMLIQFPYRYIQIKRGAVKSILPHCGKLLAIQRSTWIQTRHGQSIFTSTQLPTLLLASGYYNSCPLLFMIPRRQEVSKQAN